ADLVITGEGRVDFQTAFGKTPAGVAAAAKKLDIPVVAIGGGLADDARSVYEHGIDGLAAGAARDMSLAEALKLSREHLANAGERVLRLILIGQRMRKNQE
ncbi:MAG: glycerate kinase, partial [Gammaproteobacteria bacterium]